MSELFDPAEILWVCDSLPQGLAILDMAGVIADAGVKDVVECVSAEEEVTNDPQAFSVNFMSPQSPKILNSVDALLFLPHHFNETAVSDTLFPQESPNFPLVLLNETDNTLSEVLRNVLSLILDLFLTGFH